MDKLIGKVAIITGAAKGMGAAHARAFVEEGAKVVMTDILEEEGKALKDELGDQAIFIPHDVRRSEDWQTVVNETQSKFGNVDILVNNAGISVSKSMFDMSEEEYRRIFEINQLSVFLGMKLVVPIMNQGGSIINISSINGLVGGAVGYTDTKFAVRGMTKAASYELSFRGIRVNSVHPGVIETPMVTEGDAVEQINQFAETIPMKRMAKPEEVTKMVVFLASDDASYSTGSEFIIDGGLTAR